MRPRKSPYPRLADALSVTPDMIYKLRRGDLRVPAGRAMQLERVTGIHRDLWLFPEDFGDPWSEWEKVGFQILSDERKAA